MNLQIEMVFFILLGHNLNISLLLMAIFIFCGTIEDKNNGTYNLLNYPILSANYSAKSKININQFAVKSDIELYKIAAMLHKNKLNLIYVIFENNQ